MQQYFLNEELNVNSTYELSKDDSNHIVRIMRKKISDKIYVVFNDEIKYICSIINDNIESVIVKPYEEVRGSNELPIKITIAIPPLKNDKTEYLIQKLTELGINKIIPITVKRCVVKLDKKKDRWDTIAKEALKQCQGVVPTVIDEIKKIDKLNLKDYDLVLVPYENEEEIFLKDILRNLKVKPSKILYIIGAEGGFEKEEIDFLKSQGAKIISLGKRILRAETAAIVTGGVIINEFF